jgi:hypothetical protein
MLGAALSFAADAVHASLGAVLLAGRITLAPGGERVREIGTDAVIRVG